MALPNLLPPQPHPRPRRETPAFAPNVQRELQLLEQEFGGRQYLVQALTFAKQTKDIRYIIGLIADPEHDHLALAEICRMGKILPGELLDALASGTELRSRLLSKQPIARRIPQVVSELMHKAADYEDDCQECMGTGKITQDPTKEEPNPGPEDCETCRGGGRLRYPAETKCRDLALEMGGLIGQGGGGISISQNVQIAQVQAGGFDGYERMQEAVDQVLYGGVAEGEIVDTPVVEAQEPPPPEEQ